MVYEALDPRDGSRLALKVLLPQAAEEQDGLLRFKREFRALARLHHPNVVRVFDAGLDDDVAFIAMELLDGVHLRAHLKGMEPGPAHGAALRRCLTQVLAALAYIHARRIVHRDLKPENVFVCRDGRVKLMDFGVARLLKSSGTPSRLLGTFAYMAPEQVTGAAIDGRSDLYALGICVYELLTGGYPFPIDPPAAALHHHVNTAPPDVFERALDADPRLVELCRRLLEKDPQDRVQSADEALAFLAEGRPASAVSLAPGEEGTEIGVRFTPRTVAPDAALAALDRIVNATVEGSGSAVLVEGASGPERRRLMEVLRHRYPHRVRVLTGTCTPERPHPDGPVRAILDEAAAIVATLPRDTVRKVLGRDGHLVAAISPRLGDGTSSGPEAPPTDVRVHKAVIGVIGRLALTRPMMLIVEDVHFADPDARTVLWNAARTFLQPRRDGRPGTMCPVALVFTCRSPAEGSNQAEGLVRRLEDGGQLERVRLAPTEAPGASPRFTA